MSPRRNSNEAAAALALDHEVGSLEPGKLADMVVLSENILETPKEELLRVEIQMTMVDGIIEFQKN